MCIRDSYFTTDICDGMAQGHDGINYSLAHRDMIANMIEIHAGATPFDAGIFVASCDKGVPAQLMGIGRTNLPSILVTGGVMDAGPDLLTLEQIGMYSAMCQRGEISEEKLTYYKQHACPSCGACSFMGTASTMQVMGEALGLMLPGSALMPATCEDLREVAVRAGRQAVELAKKGLRARDIVTKMCIRDRPSGSVVRSSQLNARITRFSSCPQLLPTRIPLFHLPITFPQVPGAFCRLALPLPKAARKSNRRDLPRPVQNPWHSRSSLHSVSYTHLVAHAVREAVHV